MQASLFYVNVHVCVCVCGYYEPPDWPQLAPVSQRISQSVNFASCISRWRGLMAIRDEGAEQVNGDKSYRAYTPRRASERTDGSQCTIWFCVFSSVKWQKLFLFTITNALCFPLCIDTILFNAAPGDYINTTEFHLYIFPNSFSCNGKHYCRQGQHQVCVRAMAVNVACVCVRARERWG